jgi:peptidoglycan/LPS O-acetylase OafA/YrhL
MADRNIRRKGSLQDALVLRRGANSLNFLRLVLASLVIVSHSITLGGFGSQQFLGNQTLGSLAVDGFFGISGYLICASALRHTLQRGRLVGICRYLWDRILRIYPAFWVCLLVTALIFGPIGWLTDHETLNGYWSHPDGPFFYVIGNFRLVMHSNMISGTPGHVPNSGGWNGSLWTLEWEFLCYLGIGLLAVLGLLMRRRVVLLLGVSVWFLEFLMYLHVRVVPQPLWTMSRFAPIFMVGALLYLYRDRVPDSGYLALGLTALAVVGLKTGQSNLVFSDWLTGPALAYPVLWLGAHLPCKRIGATNDISYGVYIYGWPVGQLMALAGLQAAGYLPFMLATLLCTLPLAVTSWWIIERRALEARNWVPPPLRRFSRKREPYLGDAGFWSSDNGQKLDRRGAVRPTESGVRAR